MCASPKDQASALEQVQYLAKASAEADACAEAKAFSKACAEADEYAQPDALPPPIVLLEHCADVLAVACTQAPPVAALRIVSERDGALQAHIHSAGRRMLP